MRARSVLATFASLVLAACSVGSARSVEATCDPPGAGYPILVAQAVPSATLLPCIRVFPPGWSYGGSEVRRGASRFWLSSDRAGFHAVEVELTASCDVEGLRDVTSSSGELDVRVYLRSVSLRPYVADRVFVFAGGCVTYRYRFGDAEQASSLAAQADDALTFVRRSVLVDLVEHWLDTSLCGAGAPPCVGEG